MLLAADSDGGDFLFSCAEGRQNLGHSGLHGGRPFLRILFEMAGWQAFDEAVTSLRRGQNLARGHIKGDCFGRLRSAVDA